MPLGAEAVVLHRTLLLQAWAESMDALRAVGECQRKLTWETA